MRIVEGKKTSIMSVDIEDKYPQKN